jgi:hypothetical protein
LTEGDSATVVSADGTTIGYRLIGAGPPLLGDPGAAPAAAGADDRGHDGPRRRRAPTFRELAPSLPYDFRIVAECAGTADRYRAVTARTLLLGGGRSGRRLKQALSTLERTLPDARRVEIAGIDHGGTENADRRRRPELVAAQLRAFAGG